MFMNEDPLDSRDFSELKRFYTEAATSCSISCSILYSRVFKLSETAARGKCSMSLAGFAHCRKRTASVLVVCSDMSNPGIIIVPERVQPRNIFSQMI